MPRKAARTQRTPRYLEALLFLIPCAVFIAHACLFRRWIVDDAGISFAYARNLSAGCGLVSQPGLPPVEGYSNFSWILLLAPFFRLGLFHTLITPKVLSAVLVLLTFFVVRILVTRELKESGFVSAVVLTLLALNTSFVVWCTSGLENPLYALLLALLLLFSMRTVTAEADRRGPALSGLLAAVAAMTRPDGIVYCVLYPITAAAAVRLRPRRKAPSPYLASILAYGASFAVLFGGFIAFRAAYFHDLVPNTYHAKGGPGVSDVVALLALQPRTMVKLVDLMGSVAGGLGGLVFAVLTILTIYRISIRRFPPVLTVLATFLLWSVAAYLLLPKDWMGEYRFATPFFVFLYLYSVILAKSTLADLRLAPSLRREAMGLTAAACLAGSAAIFAYRSVSFAVAPIVPFDRIVQRYARGFDRCAAELGAPRPSLLIPDLGGTLYYSKLRIYDLAGLCDKTIAKTLRKNQQGFYDYVFEAAKPTFIHTHGVWTYAAKLDEDPRFRRDYVPIREAVDSFVKQRYRVAMYSGDYVRRDALCSNPESLARLRRVSGPTENE